ncbi:hypothetical protein ACFCYN_20515 [Gottfriedia sp. NPDC056225]|uniref:hypothetical protein n=1 Tax=Gottfriedia sp. NPDC056225 TaxID=3345751 RepID=UPI0035D74D35
MIENGRFCSNQFGVDPQQVERKEVDECLGCKREIYEGDEVLQHPDGLFHDEIDCFVEYIRDVSYSTNA